MVYGRSSRFLPRSPQEPHLRPPSLSDAQLQTVLAAAQPLHQLSGNELLERVATRPAADAGGVILRRRSDLFLKEFRRVDTSFATL